MEAGHAASFILALRGADDDCMFLKEWEWEQDEDCQRTIVSPDTSPTFAVALLRDVGYRFLPCWRYGRPPTSTLCSSDSHDKRNVHDWTFAPQTVLGRAILWSSMSRRFEPRWIKLDLEFYYRRGSPSLGSGRHRAQGSFRVWLLCSVQPSL
ncbi:hypothetical protein BDV96DRAFT_193279 [Lophiotrema nucula]|uniref:Uncharacterized protein n=1 Tax=Lophiotrema nucula TaxID=690887 RepID=A0A6A5YXQ9_9PLEO|nr:hypothetical protein BDV96DRAFT_193279 [Lophiotrema nucula]